MPPGDGSSSASDSADIEEDQEDEEAAAEPDQEQDLPEAVAEPDLEPDHGDQELDQEFGPGPSASGLVDPGPGLAIGPVDPPVDGSGLSATKAEQVQARVKLGRYLDQVSSEPAWQSASRGVQIDEAMRRMKLNGEKCWGDLEAYSRKLSLKNAFLKLGTRVK